MIKYILIPLLCFLAMFGQDVLCVWLVRAEADGRAHAAGMWDATQDAFQMAGRYTGYGVLFVTHNITLTVLTIVATLTADYFGTRTGVKIGIYLDKKRESDAAK